MSPTSPSWRPGGERIALSPISSGGERKGLGLSLPKQFCEVPAFPGVQDKENLASSQDKENVRSFSHVDTNIKIFEDSMLEKPVVIGFEDSSSNKLCNDTDRFCGVKSSAPPKKSAIGRQYSKPYTDIHEKPAPKVRLGAELAHQGLLPAIFVFIAACILAASHSDEDHSFSTIHRAISTGIEDLHDEESWLSWMAVFFAAALIVAGLICAYICHTSVGRHPKKAKDRDEDRPSVVKSSRRHYGTTYNGSTSFFS